MTNMSSVKSRDSNIPHCRKIKSAVDCQGSQLNSGQAGHMLGAQAKGGEIGGNLENPAQEDQDEDHNNHPEVGQ